MFRVYDMDLVLNEKHFKKVWIDPHYEEKHGDSIHDDLILDLLLMLDGQSVDPVDESKGFHYYEADIELHKRLYRLILVIPLHSDYLGVRNAYRRSK